MFHKKCRLEKAELENRITALELKVYSAVAEIKSLKKEKLKYKETLRELRNEETKKSNDITVIDKYLNSYELIQSDISVPKMSEVLDYASDLVKLGATDDLYRSFLSMACQLNSEGATAKQAKEIIYGLGVALNENHGSKFAIRLFKWAIATENTYHPAYNRAGDSHLLLGLYEPAISWYKTAIIHSRGKKGSEHSGKIPVKNYTGDSYMKIGYCLWKVGHSEWALKFIGHAQKMVSADFCSYEDLGFSNWRQLKEAVAEKEV